MFQYLFKYFIILLICFCAIAQVAFAQPEVRHTVLIAGRSAGKQIAVIKPDGTREFNFEYNDRGRGPKQLTRVKLDAEGYPIFWETTGYNDNKVPTNESFSISEGVARWKLRREGERKLTGKEFYVYGSELPERWALLAQALLKSPGRRLTLFSEGEASIEKVGELTLRQKDKTQPLTIYQINIGFYPRIIWLDENQQFFAMNYFAWTTVIREGWEESAPVLVRTEDRITAKRYSKLYNSLARIPTKPVAFTNADLFDSVTGKTIPNTTVIIEGNKIKAVGETGKIKIPQNAEIIDANGKTLMPGLWDMHVHLAPGGGIAFLGGGVTSVRDLGNDIERLALMRDRINSEQEIGPRISSSILIDGRGEFVGPTKALVDSVAEAKEAIKTCKQTGCTEIKIYSSIKPELVPQIIKLAHSEGLRAGGHVPAFMSAEKLINAGADEIHHLNFIFLNFWFDELQDTSGMARITEVGSRAAALDLNSEKVRSFVKLLKDKKIVVDPTLNVYENQFVRGFGFPIPEGKTEQYRNSFKAMSQMVKILYDSGVTITAGTDAGGAWALHRELELYVEAGIPANEVLRIATLGAAKIMKLDRKLGSIEAGKLADVILVDGNPAERISDIRSVSLVVKNGRIYDSKALYKSIGIER